MPSREARIDQHLEVEGDELNAEENIVARYCAVPRIQQIPEIRDVHGHQVLAIGEILWCATLCTNRMFRGANARQSHCWSIL